MAREGALQIFDTVQNIAGDKADLKSWEEKIRNYKEDDEVSSVIEPNNDEDENLPLTLGMIGHPVSISYFTTTIWSNFIITHNWLDSRDISKMISMFSFKVTFCSKMLVIL